MKNCIIIYGPQACGKTRHAKQLAEMFNCKTIVDDWDGVKELPDHALVLTNRLRWYEVEVGKVSKVG